MHVNKWWLVKINAHNGFDLTHLLRQTTPASLATFVVNVEHSLANRGTYQLQHSYARLDAPQRERLHELRDIQLARRITSVLCQSVTGA